MLPHVTAHITANLLYLTMNFYMLPHVTAFFIKNVTAFFIAHVTAYIYIYIYIYISFELNQNTRSLIEPRQRQNVARK